jgi:hypothetical protein
VATNLPPTLSAPIASARALTLDEARKAAMTNYAHSLTAAIKSNACSWEAGPAYPPGHEVDEEPDRGPIPLITSRWPSATVVTSKSGRAISPMRSINAPTSRAPRLTR